MITTKASFHIGNAEKNVVVSDVDQDIKFNRAKIAIETRDQRLIAEWLLVYAPERLETLKTLRKFGAETLTRQAVWAIACECDFQQLKKELMQ